MKMNFTVIIDMSGTSEDFLFTGNVKYGPQWDGTDNIKISEKKIEIRGIRTTESEIDTVEGLYRSRVYNQIIKSLLFLYAVSENSLKIESITVIKNKTTKKFSDVNQLFVNIKQIQIPFEKDELKVIFDETLNGSSLKDALFFLLRSLDEQNGYLSFELVWKSFNIIYYNYGKKNSDFDNQVEIRNILLSKETFFPESKKLIATLSQKDIRDNFRWRKFVFNDFPKRTSNGKSHAEAFKCFIERYHDSRIMNLFSEIICYKESELKDERLYTECINHINYNSTTKNDMELVVLIAIKYAYFVRNKLTHGEENDLTFSLLSRDSRLEEVKFITKLIQILIIEILNNNSSF